MPQQLWMVAYQRKCSQHVSAQSRASRTSCDTDVTPSALEVPRRHPMSINVEMIGTALIVQNYRYGVSQPHYCKMVSNFDVLTTVGWTTTEDLGTADGADRR
jgi:hypothetical protein